MWRWTPMKPKTVLFLLQLWKCQGDFEAVPHGSPLQTGAKGGVFLHSFPYKCLCLERHALVALWIISRPTRSAWLPVQPPWCLGMSLLGHCCQLSPKPHPEGGGYSGPAWGGGFHLPRTPKVSMDARHPSAKALKYGVFVLSGGLCPHKSCFAPGCSSAVVLCVGWENVCVFKMLSGSGSTAPGRHYKCLNLAWVDVLKLSVRVSACRVRTSVINNN